MNELKWKRLKVTWYFFKANIFLVRPSLVKNENIYWDRFNLSASTWSSWHYLWMHVEQYRRKSLKRTFRLPVCLTDVKRLTFDPLQLPYSNEKLSFVYQVARSMEIKKSTNLVIVCQEADLPLMGSDRLKMFLITLTRVKDRNHEAH